ncbi:MAG: acyltransferase [Bacteroidota bacterium]|nr:acyltransferase [Bacteroidota bacterium]
MKEYIPSLNGLRAISIILVLFAHVVLKNFHFIENPGGQIGVTIFFIISGYLITLLLLKEEETKGTISLRSFYIRRTIRIFPIYYFLLAVYLILQLAGVLNFSTNSWITSLTYTKYFTVTNGSEWESGHLWSLSIEEHFYLIWPLIFKFLKKYRIFLAFAIIIIVTLIRLVTDVSVMHILTRGDALMWGCVFAIYSNRLMFFLNSIKKEFQLVPFIILLLVLAFKRFFTLMGAHEYENWVTTFFGSYGLLTNLSVGFVILISIHCSNTVWYRFLNNGILNYIGKLSYSIYLWQQLFFSSRLERLSSFPYNIVAIFIVAFLSFNLVEKPFLNLRSRLNPILKK